MEQSKRRTGVDGIFTPGGFSIEQPTYSIFVFVFDFDRKKPNSVEQVKLAVVASQT